MKTLFTLLIIVFLFSCSERRHVQQPIQPAEKVVVISYDLTRSLQYDLYKVKRIEKGVTEWIKMSNTPLYSTGDTIFWRFTK